MLLSSDTLFAMLELYKKIRPVLFGLEPENAHRLALNALRMNFLPKVRADKYAVLEQKIWSRRFANPLGLAAGFDKNGEAIQGLERLGFGFIEVGTVTPLPQQGNPKPRIFRDAQTRSLINRMGFPNEGAEGVHRRLRQIRMARPDFQVPIGINIGKNRMQSDPYQDYATLIEQFYDVADYLVINISSPNTPDLRNLQMGEHLQNLLDLALDTREKTARAMEKKEQETRFDMPPILVKFSPDLSEKEIHDAASICLKTNIDGLIISNTTTVRPDHLPPIYKDEGGGLSGAPLGDMATAMIRDFCRLSKGRLPIIGVGGISSGHDAYMKIKAGASLLQIYSALVFEGPAVVNRILNQLALLLEQDGFKNIKEAIGIEAN